MQPGYSLEPMAVGEEQHILLVHIDNIPDFFKEIAGHPRLIPPRTLEQKKETKQKRYHEGGGKEAKSKWYHEDGGQEIKQRYDHQRKLHRDFELAAHYAKFILRHTWCIKHKTRKHTFFTQEKILHTRRP